MAGYGSRLHPPEVAVPLLRMPPHRCLEFLPKAPVDADAISVAANLRKLHTARRVLSPDRACLMKLIMDCSQSHSQSS